MPATLTLLSPAKLNLFLHVTGRRDDGYHLLQTLFRFVDYGDSLRFARNRGRSGRARRGHSRFPGSVR